MASNTKLKDKVLSGFTSKQFEAAPSENTSMTANNRT